MPGVLEPHLDVRRGVDDLALHRPRVAAVEPAGEPLVPGAAALDDPVGEDLAPATGGEVSGRGADDVLDDAVAGEPGVAVDEALTGGRRDHERRVGGDEVEGLPGDRCEERAVADLDVGGAVEERVDPGDPQGAGVDVGGHHLAAVPGQVQRLDAAAGAEVQRPADRLADGEPGQRRRRGADAEDVVGADPVGGAPSRPGVRSLTTQRSVSSSEYGRQSRRAATSPTLRSSRPSAQSASTRPGSAASAAASGTGCWSRNSRVSVSTGDPPPVRRRPGTVSLREGRRAPRAQRGRPPRRTCSPRPEARRAAGRRRRRSHAHPDRGRRWWVRGRPRAR